MRDLIRYIIALGSSILLFIVLPIWMIIKYFEILF